jgi:hypothetical protein
LAAIVVGGTLIVTLVIVTGATVTFVTTTGAGDVFE